MWAALAPPKEILGRLRWFFLTFALFFVVTFLPQIFLGSHRPVAVRAASALLLILLGLWWLRCYRRQSFPAAGLLLECAAFLSCVLTPEDPFKGLGLLYIAVNFRTLYGTFRQAIGFAGLALVCFVGAALAAPHLGSIDRGDLIYYVAPGVPPLAVITHLVARASTMVARATARERALSRAGLAIAECAGAAEIRAVGLTAFRELIASVPDATAGFAGERPAAPAAGSTLDLPIHVDGVVVDHLRITSPRPLPPEVGDALSVLSAQLELGLSNARLTETLRDQAERDTLTGLANRRAAEERIRTALAAGPIGLIMLDLDGFKRVNDELGHAAGDALLVELSRRMRLRLGTGDVLARLGGDEFLCLLDRIHDESDVCPVAERILEAVREPVHLSGDVVVEVGGSLGVVTGRPGDALEQLMNAADAAMYEAKRAGKNRIRMAAPADLASP